MRLLADCGNSTIKLALAHDGGIWLDARLPAGEAALDGFIKDHDAGITELAVMPGGRLNTDAIERWWARVGRGRRMRMVGAAGPAGLALPDLGQYPNCGADRVLAGLVACAQERRSLVVLDAGTATTVSAWLFTREERDPLLSVRFAGGLILPGARSCILGLTTQAPALPLVEPLGPSASARQHDTIGAIGAAIGIGYGPMVAACMLKLERESGIHDNLATGGNCSLLIESQVVTRLAYRPTLVLEGLELLCRLGDRE